MYKVRFYNDSNSWLGDTILDLFNHDILKKLFKEFKNPYNYKAEIVDKKGRYIGEYYCKPILTFSI